MLYYVDVYEQSTNTILEVQVCTSFNVSSLNKNTLTHTIKQHSKHLSTTTCNVPKDILS